MPTVPLLAPAMDLAVIAQGSDLENPNSTQADIVQLSPKRMIGFRPTRSEVRPHGMPVRHWLNENTADVTPAWYHKLGLQSPELVLTYPVGNIFWINPKALDHLRLQVIRIGSGTTEFEKFSQDMETQRSKRLE